MCLIFIQRQRVPGESAHPGCRSDSWTGQSLEWTDSVSSTMCHFFIGTTYEIKNNDDNSIKGISRLTNKLHIIVHISQAVRSHSLVLSITAQVQFQFQIRNLPSMLQIFPDVYLFQSFYEGCIKRDLCRPCEQLSIPECNSTQKLCTDKYQL